MPSVRGATTIPQAVFFPIVLGPLAATSAVYDPTGARERGGGLAVVPRCHGERDRDREQRHRGENDLALCERPFSPLRRLRLLEHARREHAIRRRAVCDLDRDLLAPAS